MTEHMGFGGDQKSVPLSISKNKYTKVEIRD